jgi:hypothetical protein
VIIALIATLTPRWPLGHCRYAGGHSEVVELLLQHGADVNARIPRTGWTALMLAGQWGHADTRTIELLIQHGADVNAQLYDGRTALMWVCGGGWGRTFGVDALLKAVDVLLKSGANVNAKTSGGVTALTMPGVHPRVAQFLKKHGAVGEATGHFNGKDFLEEDKRGFV